VNANAWVGMGVWLIVIMGGLVFRLWGLSLGRLWLAYGESTFIQIFIPFITNQDWDQKEETSVNIKSREQKDVHSLSKSVKGLRMLFLLFIFFIQISITTYSKL